MKLLAPATLLFLLSPTAQADHAEASARRFMDAWVEAFNKNDPARISALYEVDERVEMLASNGMALMGHRATSDSYNRDMELVRFYDSKSREMRVRSFEKTAIASFIHRFKYEILESGTHCEVHIRTTTALRKTAAGWRIVMEHSSPIQGIPRVRVIEE